MMNGLNGGAGAQMTGSMGGAMGGIPAPAGYSAELSYIHAMVEELSRQLAENKRVLDDVVTGVGRVRNRARTQQLGNEELVAGAAGDLQDQAANMDATISVLSEALEAAKYAKEANAALATQYAGAMAEMLKQFHAYKQRHVADVAAWHRSYRHQLAEARAENSRLRDQIWDLQRHAGSANALLRDFRRRYDEDPARWERRVQDRALRQELRYWKRMAMPGLPDDDADAWSDDDDLVDPAEKIRLRELEQKANEERLQQQRLQQQLQQQQQRLQIQQQQYEQQVVAVNAPPPEMAPTNVSDLSLSSAPPPPLTRTATAIIASSDGALVDDLSLDDLSRAAAAADDTNGLDSSGNGFRDDEEDDDDDDDDDEEEDEEDDEEETGGLGGDGDGDGDGTAPAPVPGDDDMGLLPAVPQAPSSAPTPLSISRMGGAAGRPDTAEAEAEETHDDSSTGTTIPVLPPRPSSAGSTGSSGF